MKASSQRTLLLSIPALLLIAGAGWWLRPQAEQRAPEAPASVANHAAPGSVRRLPPTSAPSSRPQPAAKAGRAETNSSPAEREVVACSQAVLAALRNRAQRLATSADARDRVVSALMSGLQMPPERQDPKPLLDGALARAPDDPWIAWIALSDCRAPECDRRSAADRLLRLDADNVMAWLVAVDDAYDRNDMVEAERLLQRAAKAERVETYRDDSARIAFERFGPIARPRACTDRALAFDDQAGVPWTMEDVLVAHAVGISSLRMPPYGAVMRMCSIQKPIPAARIQACRAIHARLATSNEWLSQMLGVSGMKAHAATAAERARWVERHRQLTWLREQQGMGTTPAHVRLGWEYGEVPAMIGVLEEDGRWPPPRDWTPGQDN